MLAPETAAPALLAAAILMLQSAPLALPDPLVPGRGNGALDVEHYEVHLILAPPRLDVRGLARLAVRLRTAAGDLELDLHDHLRVEAAAVDGQRAAFVQGDHRLRVSLPRAADPGRTLRLDVRYTGQLPKEPSQGEHLGFLPDGRCLVTYLEPDGAHNVFPCNDHPSDKATFDFYLTVPWGQVGAASGVLRGWEPLPAAQRWHWGTDRPLATYLVGLAAGPFETIHRTGEVPILDLCWPQDAARVRANLEPVTRMIPFLAARFGPFPFERYGHVFTDRMVGGLECQTMTVLGRDAGLSGDQELLVHELAHQWFGDWVTPRQWRDLWLNEGWATYAELLWNEEIAEAEGRQRALAIWRWSTLRLEETDSPWTLASPDPSDLFDSKLVYHKGGLVLHVLAGYLGRERFFAAARSYLRRHGGGNASTEDFQAAMSEFAGEGLADFFAAWVRSNAVPLVRVQLWTIPRAAGWRAVASLRQEQPGPWHPLASTVRFASADGTRTADVPVRFAGRSAAAAVVLDFEPARAVFDPGEELPWRPAP